MFQSSIYIKRVLKLFPLRDYQKFSSEKLGYLVKLRKLTFWDNRLYSIAMELTSREKES